MDEKTFCEKGLRFMELAKLLFSGKTDIYDINELDENNEFYKDAVKLAEEMEIDWKTMSHEDSNRIMLALLEDTYLAMKPDKWQKAMVKFELKEDK